MQSSCQIAKMNEAARIYAEENLNETEETRTNSLDTIKKWLEEEARYLNAKKEDKHILPFLRGCKFDLEKTKVKMTNYYKMKRDCPEWFSDRNPALPQIQELIKMGVFVPLKRTSDNEMVVIIKTAAHDPRKQKQDDVFKTGKMILDVAVMEYELVQIYGIIAIFDMKGVGLVHARHLPPNMIKKAVHAWQNYHCRPKQLEFINAPRYINVVLNIFKSFMSNKLKGRVSVHSQINTFHNVLDKDILPPEYGGKGEGMEELIEYWRQKLDEYSQWFKEDEHYKAM